MAAKDYDVVALVRACKAAGFVYGKGLQVAVAVSLAEDGARDLTAVFVNSDQWQSRDRGPFQINDHWHAEVSDACAFDLACSAKEAYRISSQGASFGPWATYKNGAYTRNMDIAFVGIQLVNSLDAEAADQAQVAGLQVKITDLQANVAKLGSSLDAANAKVSDLTGQLAGANEAAAIQAAKYLEASSKLDQFRAARDAVIALKDV